MGYLNAEQLQAIAHATASYVNSSIGSALTSYAKLNHNNAGSFTTSGNIMSTEGSVISTKGNLECSGAIFAADSKNTGNVINGYLTIGSIAKQTTYKLLVNGTSNFTGDVYLKVTGNGETPKLWFQRGEVTDTYNDWNIKNSSGSLIFSTVYNNNTYTGLTLQYATTATNGVVVTPWKINAALGFFETSDERKKNFAESIDIDFDKLKALKKNYFTWKDSDNTDRQIGVSAQEIMAIYPELVSEDNEGTLSVAYDKLSVIALKAVDKLYDKNVELENRIEELEKKIDAILSRIN